MDTPHPIGSGCCSSSPSLRVWKPFNRTVEVVYPLASRPTVALTARHIYATSSTATREQLVTVETSDCRVAGHFILVWQTPHWLEHTYDYTREAIWLLLKTLNLLRGLDKYVSTRHMNKAFASILRGQKCIVIGCLRYTQYLVTRAPNDCEGTLSSSHRWAISMNGGPKRVAFIHFGTIVHLCCWLGFLRNLAPLALYGSPESFSGHIFDSTVGSLTNSQLGGVQSLFTLVATMYQF